MGLCPTNCGPLVLVENPQSGCTTSIRYTTPARFAFFPCDTSLPDPITDQAMEALFTDGTIVASMSLGNFIWADPTTEDVLINDCSLPEKIIVSREATFEDRNAISLTSGSPSTTDDFFDYDFWQDKNNNQTRLAFMVIYCNGDVKIARDVDGSLLQASVLVYLSYQKPGTTGGKTIEFKKGSIVFNGDPLNLANKPEFNTITAGIALP